MGTLLLADDSVTTQRVIALTFAEESFRVVTVSDGQQALDAMAAARPDIVLASTMLPRISGYDLAQRLREIPALRDVPVLLLSGAFESVDAARLKASGARGVVEKPLEPTAVISRVRELLGFKDTRPAASAGRLVTSADGPDDRKGPGRPPMPPAPRTPVVSTWDELRKTTGLEPDALSVEGGAPTGREDYFGTLDAAFDSLDQHLAGRQSDSSTPPRNPSPPLGQASGAADPRLPGRRPAMTAEGRGANSVFEVDNDWFSNDHKDRDRATTDEMVADAHEAMSPRPPAAPGASVFEVDDDWFAVDEHARSERASMQRDLAAEMGIHDVELPAVEPGAAVPASTDGLDFDFGLDELVPQPSPASPDQDWLVAPPVMASPVPTPIAPPPAAPVAHAAPAAPLTPLAPSSVADDFAALLAYETGDAVAPLPSVAAAPTSAPIVVQAPVPEITEVMLDQIAQRVADRLNSSNFGADLREAMTRAIRETVRTVVSDTSERLVREEIGRVKAKAERDTQ